MYDISTWSITALHTTAKMEIEISKYFGIKKKMEIKNLTESSSKTKEWNDRDCYVIYTKLGRLTATSFFCRF